MTRGNEWILLVAVVYSAFVCILLILAGAEINVVLAGLVLGVSIATIFWDAQCQRCLKLAEETIKTIKDFPLEEQLFNTTVLHITKLMGNCIYLRNLPDGSFIYAWHNCEICFSHWEKKFYISINDLIKGEPGITFSPDCAEQSMQYLRQELKRQGFLTNEKPQPLKPQMIKEGEAEER